jgi:hypothetical protein
VACVLLAGQVIVGFCASFTVTMNVQVLVFPAASVAPQMTVLAPIGKGNPLAKLGAIIAATTPEQLSVAVGAA